MPRQNTSQRVSGRNKRKLPIDDSDEISLDRNVDLCKDFDMEVAKDSQTSLEGHRDLFGELIPPDECVVNEEVKNKSIKKTPVSKKKKQPYEELLFDTPKTRPKRVFITTPKIMKLMHEAQKELYSVMGASTSSSNVSVVSTDSLNVSGVQQLQDSPGTSIRNESKINNKEDDNENKSQKVLEGVIAFVDYKIDDDPRDTSINQRLIELGAKVEKTFNRKVTHVMFCDGYRSTYKKAVERNIPLVSARWMEYSKLANKIQSPADYPPVGMEKYTTTPIKNLTIRESTTYKKFLDPSYIELDQLFKKKCDNIMKQFNRSLNRNVENEGGSIMETPEKIVNKHVDIENILSDQLCKELKKVVSPVPDEQTDELNVPLSIKILRNHLTPNVKENTISKDAYSQIAKIEDRLNLNFQAKKRFRQLLFPSDKDLNNIDKISDLSTQTKDNDSGTESINSMSIQTPEYFLEDDVTLQSIACIGIVKSEVNILKSFIKNLGKFVFHTKVKPTTTYLITKSLSNQSLDIVFAMAYGCFIVSEDWVLKSYSIGRWLSHEKYLIPELSEPVKNFQIRRHTVFGSNMKFNIFNKAGKIYISNNCESPAKLLKRLVHACGGHCTSNESTANIVIGKSLQFNSNIHEKWIFDCIYQGTLLNKYQY